MEYYIPKYKNDISKSFSNDSSEYIIELNDNLEEKIDLHKIFENNYDEIRNTFPYNTINKKEIFRAYDYSFYELKSNFFKENDYLKRAKFYFSIYFSINNKPNKKFLEITKNKKLYQNKYKFSINFSNTHFTEEENKEFNFLDNNNINKSNIFNSQKVEKSNENIFYNINLNSSSSNTFNKYDNEYKNNENKEDIDINKNKLIGQKRKVSENSNYNIENKKYKQIYKEINFNKIHNSFISNNNILQKNEEEETKNNKKYNSNGKISSDLEDNENIFCNKNILSKNDEDIKYTEKIPSKELLKRKLNDKVFLNFQKNLNDFLHKIIDETRKKYFFEQVLDESRDIIKNLFINKKIFPPNIKIPLFRNNYLELSLVTKNNGMLKKQILYIKE